MIKPIRVHGLRELQGRLRQLDRAAPRQLRVAHNQAAQLVVDWAAPRVPKRSGRAGRSVKARSGQREARVVGGSTRVPYYPWLDFGGRVGPANSVRRTFKRKGRYIYPGFERRRDRIQAALVEHITRAARDAGLEPT